MYIEYIGNVLYDKKILQTNRRLIIFGCGICGKSIAEYIIKYGKKESIICFCDSNSDFEKYRIMEIPVRKPIEVCQIYPKADYLISGKYSREMYSFLKENYIDKIHILV